MSTANPDGEDFDAEALLADLEPLEDLDDAEFGLPPIENPPTLEEILAANDDNDEDLEDNIDLDDAASSASTLPISQAYPNTLSVALRQLNNSATGDTLSVGSDSKSRGSSRSQKSQQNKKDKGSIMRHVILKGISAQTTHARERANAGLPTAMAAGNFVAIGTSHGFILVFDGNQTLKYSLGGQTYGRECGSVSCLAFDHNPEEGPTRLLAGFAKGHLLEYDLTTGKLLRKLDDAHVLGSAIIRARFTHQKALALICDSGGSIFELSLKKTLGMRSYSSRCIFSGSRGEVCTFEPMPDQNNQLMSERIVVALATVSKVIVLTIRPSMKVLFTHPLTGGLKTLPILSWQFVIIQTSKANKVVDPVLAFGRQSTIYFYQLSETISRKINFIPLQRVDLPFELLNFGWLNSRCMAFMDTTESFHLYDVRNQENLESIDISDVQLVYGSAFFKGLATGGNVSAAMAASGEKATYESFMTFTNQMVLLGRNTFHVLMIRSWNERIDYLVKANNYLDCLALGMDFYTDQGKALVGLKGPKEKRKTVIAQKMLSVLLKYLDVCMKKNFPQEGNMAVLKDYFATVVPPCVHTCIALKNKEILFENTWNAFEEDPFAKATYLECLESYILSDQLRNLPVNICQEFVSHYEITERFMALEACVTHLNVISLDINQVMKISKEHGLYDAIIYIYNNGMLDYVTPAEELLNILMNAMDSSKDYSTNSHHHHHHNGLSSYESVTKRMTSSQIKLGNKLLVYISCCLAGRAYPYGDIAKDQVETVKKDVYNCLTRLHAPKKANINKGQSQDSTSVSGSAADHELLYPYLRTLLSFDTQGFLNVLSIAFEEPEFKSDMGLCLKQQLVDNLLKIMVRDTNNTMDLVGGSTSFSPSQVAYLFTFLAQQITKDDHCLTVELGLFDQVLNVITDTREHSHYEERQQALLDMLNAGGLEYFDQENLIHRAEKVQFYRILEMLYDKRKEHVKLLGTYINDAYRKNQAFSFLQRVLYEDISDDKRSQVEKSVLDDLDALISIDMKKTAMIIYMQLYPYVPLVLAKLETKKDILYEFLKHLLDLKESGSQPTTPVHGSRRSGQAEDPLTTYETYETLIDLMCQLEAKSVASYLRSKNNYYRPEVALRLATKYEIKDAQAYLLEQDGKLLEAFALMKSDLKNQIETLTTTSGKNGSPDDDHDDALSWSKLNATVILIIQLCQRSSLVLSVNERDDMWFKLLDTLMESQRSKSQNLKDLVRHVVTSSLGHISLRSVVDRILRDDMYQSDNLGNVQEFLKEMLEMYHYETTLMKSTTQAIHSDIHAQQLQLQAESRRGLAVHTLGCGLCGQHIAKAGGRTVVFNCGHKFHTSCLSQAGCKRQVFGQEIAGGEELWLCYICLKNNQAIFVEDEQNQLVIDTNVEEDQDEPPDELINEITNQSVVQAHQYVKAMKKLQNYNFENSTEENSTSNTTASIFDREDFQLNLSRKPEDQV